MMALDNGFLILDKPRGISSAKAVAEVKKLLTCKKIGHGGTLDPLACGVLPLAIGEATKAFDYVASTRKEYRFTIIFGQERSTDDAEGEITATTPRMPTREEIENALREFTGRILQTPPIYSALHVDGKRAYALARAGKEVKLEARPVEVFDLQLLSTEPESGKLQLANLSVTCGKGTYVRALARDIARKCNSLGYISTLRRVSVGKFHEKNAISLDKLHEHVHNAALLKAWVPIELALDDIPAISLNPDQALALRQGKMLHLNTGDGTYMALYQGHIVALTESEGGVLRSKRVFNINEKETFDVARATEKRQAN